MNRNNTIWKFELKEVELQIVRIPEGADILSLGIQGEEMFLWAAVDEEAETEAVQIRIVGTGWVMGETTLERRFLGTLATPAGLVWHVFREDLPAGVQSSFT